MSIWGSAIQVHFYGIGKIVGSLGSKGWCAWHTDHQSKQVCCSPCPENKGKTTWQAKSMYRKEGRFERHFFWDPNTTVPVLPGVELNEDMIMEHWMEPGDIVLFNTCLWHRSPPIVRVRNGAGFAAHICSIKSHSRVIPQHMRTLIALGASMRDLMLSPLGKGMAVLASLMLILQKSGQRQAPH